MNEDDANYMEPSSSWKASSRSTVSEFTGLARNPSVY
jgi:hypothetical protein